MSQLATQQPQIIEILQRPRTRDELLIVMPPDCDVDELISRARQAILSNPDLQRCTPQSVLLAVKKSVTCGLSLDGRNCHLVPYGQQCTFIVDWKGYVALGKRCGIPSIFAELVRTRDTFRIWVDEKGKHLIHDINIREPRGEVLGAYCQTVDRHGFMDWEWMSLEQIKALQAAKGKGAPWRSDWDEMARKTVIRRHSKRWDIDIRFRSALEDDDKLDAVEPVQAAKLVYPDEVAPVVPQLDYVEGGDVLSEEQE